MMLWPLVLIGSLFLKVPLLVAMVAFLPLYGMVFQFAMTMVGAFIFTREFGLRLPISMPLVMTVTWLPYQWILGWAALRAGYRELNILTNWEKTAHAGAHRRIAGRRLPWRTRARQLLADAPGWAWRLGARSVAWVVGMPAAIGGSSTQTALSAGTWAQAREMSAAGAQDDHVPSAAGVPRAMAIRATLFSPPVTSLNDAPRTPQPAMSAALTSCSTCGAVIQHQARFCRRCGSALSDLMVGQ
jgi:hypothetical protein